MSFRNSDLFGTNSVLSDSLSRNGFATTGAARQPDNVNNIAKDLLEFIKTSDVIEAPRQVVYNDAANRQYLSDVEAAILRSTAPIEAEQSEEITVNDQRGTWINKGEVVNWRGVIPITEYQINQDENPEVITKQTTQLLEYIQELAIRYLRPPTPPAPGEIVITQEANVATPPAPPLVIRQQPPRPATPEPLVIREAPPPAPPQVGRKVITISGKRLPPPPRKVVIERLAPLPSKPQSVIVERWLPYSEVKRRVIFQKSNVADPVVVKPRNVIVQWEAPRVVVKKEYKYLGVIRANPVDYVQRYGTSLKASRELPDYVLDIKTPEGLVLAADYKYNNLHELEGDVSALRLIDLDREGLGEYRSYLSRLGTTSSYVQPAPVVVEDNFQRNLRALGYTEEELNTIVQKVFASIDTDSTGTITVEEAGKTLLKLNSRLNRRYGESDLAAFFNALDVNGDGSLNFEEFKKAFVNLISA